VAPSPGRHGPIEPDHDGHWRVNGNADWYTGQIPCLDRTNAIEGAAAREHGMGWLLDNPAKLPDRAA
jgi:hypothetical protein